MTEAWRDPFLTAVRAAPFYAGQVCHAVETPARPATVTPLDELSVSAEERAVIGHVARAFGVGTLYTHQAQALTCLLAGGDVAALAGPATGHATLARIAVATWYLARGGTILWVRGGGAPPAADVDAWRQGVERMPFLARLREGAPVGDDLPHLWMTTPKDLSRAMARGGDEGAARFLSQVGLVVWEGIDQGLGVWGPDTTLLFRRLWIACGRGPGKPRLLVTGSPFANARAVVSATTARRFDGEGAWIDRATAPRRPLLTVWWLPPLRTTSTPGVCRRGHFLGDLKAVLSFLVAPDSSAETADLLIHYCLDASGSTEEERSLLKRAQRLVEADARRNIEVGRRVRISFFREQGIEETWRSWDEAPLADFLTKVEAKGSTNLAHAIRGALEQSEEDGPTALVVVGGHMDPVDEAAGAQIEVLWRQAKVSRLCCVALDVEPGETVRALVASLGGEVVVTPAEGLDGVWSTRVEHPASAEQTEVALLVLDESVGEGDLAEIAPSAARRVVVCHSLEEVARRGDRAFAVVVVGCTGPVKPLQRALSSGRGGRRVVFLYGNEDPAIMTPFHFRHGEPSGLDRRHRLPLPAAHRLARERHLAALLQGGELAVSELLDYFDIERGGSADEVRRRLGRAAAELPGLWVDKEAFRAWLRGVWLPPGGGLPVAREPLDGHLLRDGRPDLELGRPSTHWGGVVVEGADGGVISPMAWPLALATLPNGGNLSLPTGRYRCHWEGEGKARQVSLDALEETGEPEVAAPLVDEGESRVVVTRVIGSPVTLAEHHLELQRVEARVRLVSGRYRPHRGAGVEQDTVHTTVPVAWEGDLPAVALAGAWLTGGAGRALALALQNGLRTLLPGDLGRGLLCLPEEGRIWVVELYPYGGIGLCDLLIAHGGALAALFHLVREVLLTCPCGTDGGAPSRDGCGCCLYSPTSPLAWDAEGCVPSKRALLDAMAENMPEDERAWQRLSDKYEGITEEGRLTHDHPPDLGPLPVMRALYRAKFGFDLRPPAVSFISEEAARRRPDLLGLYRGRDGAIFVRKELCESQALDVMAHELAHHWRHTSGRFAATLRASDLPYDGKLFLEGSAEWLSIHMLQSLSLREEIGRKDLRAGDGYGDGFEILKYVESRFGAGAVFLFLETGDVAAATGGEIPGLRELCQACGLATLANAVGAGASRG